MKRGIIWDLDGTLWDSSTPVRDAWNAWMERHGFDRRFTREQMRGYCGKTLEQIAALVFPDVPEAERNARVYGCCDLENEFLAERGGILYPQEQQVLCRLAEQYHMSIVSNCGQGYIEAYLTAHHMWPLFDDRENAVNTGMGKAENIRLVMERNGLDCAVYVGDTQGDWQAATRAGAVFVHAAYGFGQAPEAEWRIASLTELPAVLERIFS